MCTVTFIPKSIDGFILTSNRDEAPDRETIQPKEYLEEGVRLLYPKDKKAGGTWLGVSVKKRLVCLLNGGFTAHNREDEYKMSRGIIVKQLLTSENAEEQINNFDFNGIEPFTIILIEWQNELQIFEFVWDGQNVHFSEKPLAPQIWSSSLLYTPQMKKKREVWFSEFLFKKLQPTAEKLLDFHKTAGQPDKNSALIMDRVFVRTKSITQVIMKDEKTTMRYEDLVTSEVNNATL